MSHIVTLKTEVKDPIAIRAACQRMELAEPVLGTAKLFSGDVTGLIVQLPGWQYPAIIDTGTGQIHFDNFGGTWGSQDRLDRFLQMYAVERAKLEARKKGHTVSETQLQDGSIKLQIQEAY